MRRHGSTLVEITVTVLIAVVVLGVVLALLVGGARTYLTTLDTAHGRQAATLFFDQLEADLAGCTVMPHRRCDPVAISEDGARLAFFRADPVRSTMQVNVAVPVEHTLVGRHPARDGVVRKSVVVESVRYELVRPDIRRGEERKATRKSWLLRVDAKFPNGSRSLRVVRLFELVQPSSTVQGPHFGGEIPMGTFAFQKGPRPLMEFLATAGLGPGISAPPPGAGRPL